MIEISCITYGLKNEQSQIYRTHTPTRMGVHLAFGTSRQYGLSFAGWWYILVRLWVELFVSQGLIQTETTVSRKASN